LARLSRSSLVYFPSRIVPALATVLSLGVAARVLGPRDFGLFSLISLSVAYITPLFGDWIVAGYQREAQTDRHGWEGDAATATLIASCLGSAILISLAAAFGNSSLVLIAILVPPTCLLKLQLGKLQMAGLSRTYSMNQAAYSLVKAAAIIVVCITLDSVPAMVISWSLVTAATVALGPRLHWSHRLRKDVLLTFLRFGGPLIIVSLALNGLATMDRYIIAILRPGADVGVYSLAYALGDGTVLLLASVPALALYPQITALWDAGETDRVQGLVRKTLLYQTVGLAGVLCVAFSAASAIPSVVGHAYDDSVRLFVMLGCANLFAAASYVVSLGPSLSRSTGKLGRLYAFVAVGNAAATLSLVHLNGLTGAAVATILTYIALLVAMVRSCWPGILGPRDLAAMIASSFVALCYGLALLEMSPTWVSGLALSAVTLALLGGLARVVHGLAGTQNGR
jgi:O-antigen/teichoic acid export membrane protein